VKIIDIITARWTRRPTPTSPRLPSLRLTDVRLTPEMVKDNERMLTGGFYAEVTLGYDASIAQEKGGPPVSAWTRCAPSSSPSARYWT
jgi:ATP-dependent Lon protease